MSNLEALRQATALSPQNIPLLLLLGQACLDELQFEDARKTYEQVLAIEPSNLEAKLGICRTHYLSGDNSGAFVRAQSLLSEYPQEARGWLLLARISMGEGQSNDAVAHYQKAIQINPALKDPSLEKDLPGSTSQKTDSTVQVGGGYAQVQPPANPNSRVIDRLDEDAADFDDDDDDDDDDEPSTLCGSIPGLNEIERPTFTFADVGGMESIKEEIRMKVLYPMNNPDLFRAYGKKIGGGVLLYGPPGCGKTLLARATAGEMKASFISVGLHQILNMYIGRSEQNLHQLFELARDNAPSVLFFDEVDALAADRSDLKHSAAKSLINVFLTEMDSTMEENEGVLILGATNAPWHIDPAFRRPGRFDRILFVPPPDDAARLAIIDILAKNKPVDKLDNKALAQKTKGFSGADLKGVFDVTTEAIISRAMKEGRIVPITGKDLLETAKTTKPSTRAWFDTAKNYAMYSNQGGFYDDVLNFLGIKL